ncbi:MAG: GGDEF domain-containing protein [Hyphomicrobiales bacterium]|nr:GGDEF domain-containing protein [Hyphomicrobiales bacterium]
MRARRFSAWFMWGSLALFGILLPLAIGQDPENRIFVDILRGLGCLGFIGGLVSLIRSSGDSAPGVIAGEAHDAVPRTLCNNPLGAYGSASLSERIDMALEASNFYDRSLGVIYYDVASYGRIARSHGATAADQALGFVLAMLQLVLRKTDRAELIGKGRFAICLPLLPDEETLHSVRKRAAKAMDKMRFEAIGAEKLEYDYGVAIYPIHGKTGAELIAHAKQNCEAARSRRLQSDISQRQPVAMTAQPRAA